MVFLTAHMLISACDMPGVNTITKNLGLELVPGTNVCAPEFQKGSDLPWQMPRWTNQRALFNQLSTVILGGCSPAHRCIRTTPEAENILKKR